MRRVDSEEAVSELAERLNGAERDRPIVVVTTPSGRPRSWIDVAKLEQQLGDLAEVVLMSAGPFTWSFANQMPPMTQVYGGAGRVYPVGHEWVSNPRASPLRFAYDEGEGKRATDHLIDDAMAMAALAGLTAGQPPTSRRRRLDGVVVGVVADRALVKLANDRVGSVSPAFAVPAVEIERVVAEGQALSGWLDEDTAWYDIREMVLPPHEALSAYRPGDVVLAEVGEVTETTAELFLHPWTPVQVGREEVTGNDLDDLRTLLTRAEVVAARVTMPGPGWRLSLLDVEDDEQPLPAVSLLRAGPPWLQPPRGEATPTEATVPDAGVPQPGVPEPGVPDATVLPEPALPESPASGPQSPGAVPTAPGAQEPSGSDAVLLDPGHSQPGHATSEAASPEHGAELERALEDALEDAEALRNELDGIRQEARMLRQVRANLEARTAHLERQLADQRARLRKAKRPVAEANQPGFADPEAGFRYAVLTAWATRTPLAEQAARPLPDFRIGPHFIPSLQRLEGIALEKVADVVFEIVTDRAKDIAGRELHVYRESEGAGAPPVRRTEDEAVLWRASLQISTASARRIHFWRLPGGAVELWHVGTHDERPP